MKRVLLLVVFGMAILCNQANAQYKLPAYKEFLGYCYGSSAGALYASDTDIKANPNSTLTFELAGSYWEGCTNFEWTEDLLDRTGTVYGRDYSVNLGDGTGWIMITVNAIDREGYTRSYCFMIEVTNNYFLYHMFNKMY